MTNHRPSRPTPSARRKQRARPRLARLVGPILLIPARSRFGSWPAACPEPPSPKALNSGDGYLLTRLRDGAWTLSCFLAPAASPLCPPAFCGSTVSSCAVGGGPLLAFAHHQPLGASSSATRPRPHAHIQDEIAMVFQAENFAKGHLYAAPPPKTAPLFDYDSSSWTPAWYGKYFFGRPCC